MKFILCLAPYTFLPAQTGGQKAIVSLYETLSKNFKVVCIGTKKNKVSEAEGFKIRNILSNSSVRYLNLFYFFKIRDIIRKEKPDYLQIEHPYLGWLAILLKKFTGIKLIVRSHNIEGLRFKNLCKWWWKLLLKYEKWVLKKADFIFFITDVDRLYANTNFHIPSKNTYTITFGINFTAPPSDKEREVARTILLNNHNINTKDIIILFNGAFNYPPNAKALYNLTQEIFPKLSSLSEKSFKLIVCGKDIPEELIKKNTNADIIFAGFVADIKTYLKGSCIFVNPIFEGGGIKTKLVEALAFNLNCVSFETGAIGVPIEICGDKLIIIKDNDWRNFASAITTAGDKSSDIPDAFYNHFSNDKILQVITDIL